MPISNRGRTSASPYFITSSTYDKKQLLQNPRYATLLVNVMKENWGKGRFSLHAYVVMADHFHVLLTPASDLALERVVQFIKGGFSFRLKKEMGYSGEVWQKSFYDRRVRDLEEFERIIGYIHMNPVRRGLVQSPVQYEFSSAQILSQLEAVPQRLKPRI